MQEIALRESLSPAVTNWLEKMRLDVSMNDEPGAGVFEAQDSIAERILQAADEDAVFEAADAGTLPTKDFIGKPFLLRSFEIRVSGLRDEQGKVTGTGFYMLLRVLNLEDMEETVLNSGAQSVLAVVWRLSELGVLSDTKKYPDGYPMILTDKSAGRGDVIIPKKFAAYTPDKSRAKASN